MAPTIRVLIADDDPATRAELAEFLGAEADIQVVGSAADGGQAVGLVLNRADAMLGIKVADAEQSLGRRIDHSIVSDGRIVVYALNRGVPFTVSNPEAQVSRDVRRLAEHLLRAGVPVPAEPGDPRGRRRLLAWR